MSEVFKYGPDGRAVASRIKELQDKKATFTHTSSNYTNTIQVGSTKYKYLTRTMNKKVWIANRLILKDLAASPLTGALNKKEYDTSSYFNCLYEEDFSVKEVKNLDISACYPYTLYIKKLITKKTLDYLLSLDKKDRLPAVGMIAFNRNTYHYVNGQLKSITNEQGPYRNIFFYVVSEVQKVLLELMDIADLFYIFHWVDGVFLLPGIGKERLGKMEQYLDSLGYSYSLSIARNFQFSRGKRGKIKVVFKRGSETVRYKFRDVHYQEEFNQALREVHAIRDQSFT